MMLFQPLRLRHPDTAGMCQNDSDGTARYMFIVFPNFIKQLESQRDGCLVES